MRKMRLNCSTAKIPNISVANSCDHSGVSRAWDEGGEFTFKILNFF
jgi:hypothetical protein